MEISNPCQPIDFTDNKQLSFQYDRAILDLGNVTGNTDCESSSVDCSVVIDYEALLVETPEGSENETYWISAGAEYLNEQNVWVGQASITVVDNETVSMYRSYWKGSTTSVA